MKNNVRYSYPLFLPGLLTMFSAIPAYYFLISRLADAKFLTSEEKTYLTERILFDGSAGGLTEIPDRKRHYIIAAFKDRKVSRHRRQEDTRAWYPASMRLTFYFGWHFRPTLSL